MGGVAGHMDHLYDNRNLTFAKMKEIMEAGANAELTTEEKVDGQNLFLSYSIPDGAAKGARNLGNLRNGGLSAEDLAQKFAGRGGIENAFNQGFKAFEKAVEALSSDEKKRIFGPDTNIWYNAEIMDPGTADDPNDPGSINVIKYDDKTLKIHDVGHFIFDRETGEKSSIPEGSLETLDAALDRMRENISRSGSNFKLARKAIIQLQKMEDLKFLREAESRINSSISAEGLSDSNTVEDYLYQRLLNGIDTDLPDSLKEELVKYLLGLPDNIGKRALKKGLKPEDKQDIDDIINSKRMLLQSAIFPIESAVHDYTVEILKGLQSVFIADTKTEVQRLKNELSKAVKEITARGPEDPQAMEIMQHHLNKIKDFSQITTPVEAVVFDYDGHTYKFAGNFAPLNQILGMFRYPRTPKKVTSESLSLKSDVITEKNGKKIALLPGGFKPPHAGHFLLAKHLANKKDVDEVIVIVSTKPRPPVNVDMSVGLWELYTKEYPNIKIQKGTTPSPVGDVYELIADNSVFQEGDVAYLGKSEKDADDKRFDRAQSYAERHNPGVKVEPIVTPLFAGGVSGTEMRNYILQGDKKEFKKNLPRHLDDEDKEKAYNIVSSSNEALNSFVDETIEEMSSMASGAVQGHSGANGFGPPNTFNVFRSKQRPKRSKPQVKRAKRQRRR